MRYKEPLFVSVWKAGTIPRCCHTCLFYNDDGICSIYGQKPPEQFTSDLDKCQKWSSFDDIPF